jgi:putative ABC transport system permease protein
MLTRWLCAARERLSALISRRSFEADLDEELHFHLDQATARHIKRGLSRDDARREALRMLGNVESIKEEVRDETGVRPLQDFGRDVRQAFRQLVQRPGFSAVAITTIAICLAANTAVFSIVYSVLLKPLPFPESHRLVRLFNSYPNSGNPRTGSSVPEYFDRRELARTLDDVALYREESNTLGTAEGGRHAFALRVTPSFFSVLRVSPALGRVFSDEQETPGARRVIIGHALWQAAFGGRRDVPGTTARLDGVAYEVVGVLPESFRFSTWDAQVFTPLAFGPRDRSVEARHRDSFQMVGRLSSGATLEAAQAEIAALNAARLDDYPPELRRTVTDAGFSTVVRPYLADLTRDVRQPLLLLWSGVLLVLVIGTANIASLLLLRSRARVREIAVRVALGAGHFRIVRQLVTESMVLAAVGGALGLLLARASLRLLSAFEVYQIPRVDDVAIDWAVVAWTTAGVVMIGAVAGITAAWSVLRRETGLGVWTSRANASGMSRAHRLLVSSQVAFALVLIMTAGLLTASLQNLLAVDPGFDEENVAVAALILPGSRYPTVRARVDFLQRTIDAVEAVPGVRRMAAASQLPFSGSGGRTGVVPEGVVVAPGDAIALPYHTAVTSGYFEALGVSIIDGRRFEAGDRDGAPRVAIIDEILARRYWSGTSAIGKRLWVGANAGDPADALTIVGVAEPIRHDSLRENELAGAVYVPLTQGSPGFVRFAVNFDGDRGAVWSAVRKTIAALDPALVPFWTDTLEASVGASLLLQRTPMQVLSGFAIVGLFLGVLGVYGVMAHEFGRRRREIAVRLAIGGSRGDIVSLMGREWILVVGTGVVVGLAGTVASSRLIASLLYDTGPLDPRVLSGALGALILAALVACLIPVRRAVRIDPAMALREE